jgi:hypothetical protein
VQCAPREPRQGTHACHEARSRTDLRAQNLLMNDLDSELKTIFMSAAGEYLEMMPGVHDGASPESDAKRIDSIYRSQVALRSHVHIGVHSSVLL